MKKIIILLITILFLNILTAFVTYTVVVNKISNYSNDNKTKRKGYIAVYPPLDEPVEWNDILLPKVEGVDYVPTPECAVDIADTVGNALYPDFDAIQHDVLVDFSKSINKWVIKYIPEKLTKEDITSIEGGSLRWPDGEYSGPFILVDKTTGEVSVYRLLSFFGEVQDYKND